MRIPPSAPSSPGGGPGTLLPTSVRRICVSSPQRGRQCIRWAPARRTVALFSAHHEGRDQRGSLAAFSGPREVLARD